MAAGEQEGKRNLEEERVICKLLVCSHSDTGLRWGHNGKHRAHESHVAMWLHPVLMLASKWRKARPVLAALGQHQSSQTVGNVKGKCCEFIPSSLTAHQLPHVERLYYKVTSVRASKDSELEMQSQEFYYSA